MSKQEENPEDRLWRAIVIHVTTDPETELGLWKSKWANYGRFIFAVIDAFSHNPDFAAQGVRVLAPFALELMDKLHNIE